MISLGLVEFLVAFLLTGLFFILSLWLYSDQRDRRYYDEARVERAYYCIRCGTVYGDSSRHDIVPCPKCRFENSPLRF